MTTHPLEVSRAQVLAYRQVVGSLVERLPPGADSLWRAAWAGLQDSMPRAALLSINARVEGTGPSTWEDPSLVQVWGPRFSAFVIAARDRGVFTLGRLPDDGERRRFAEEMAARVESLLAGRRMTYGEAGRALGVSPNSLRYAAPTGRVLMRWDGARQPTIWTVPPRRSIRGRLASSSRAGTCTCSVRRRPRPSASGRGSGRTGPAGRSRRSHPR